MGPTVANLLHPEYLNVFSICSINWLKQFLCQKNDNGPPQGPDFTYNEAIVWKNKNKNTNTDVRSGEKASILLKHP